jgi:hypothetical protein
MKYLIITIMAPVSFFMAVDCSLAETDRLYANCISIGMEEQMVGWDESDRPSVKKGVEMGCGLLIKECKDNPDGEMCKAFRNKFNAALR